MQKTPERRRGTRGVAASADFDTDADFARMVNRVRQSERAGAPCDHPNADHLDVRRVALGLANIESALLHQIEKMKARGPHRPLMSEIGLLDAMEILAALTGGGDHPIRNYIDGVRTINLGRRHPTFIETNRRAILVGLMRAFQTATRSSEIEAAREVIAVCRYASGVELTYDKLRKWDSKFRREGSLDLAAAWARDIIAKAETRPEPWPLPRLILARGAYLIRDQLATPRLAAQPPSTAR